MRKSFLKNQVLFLVLTLALSSTSAKVFGDEPDAGTDTPAVETAEEIIDAPTIESAPPVPEPTPTANTISPNPFESAVVRKPETSSPESMAPQEAPDAPTTETSDQPSGLSSSDLSNMIDETINGPSKRKNPAGPRPVKKSKQRIAAERKVRNFPSVTAAETYRAPNKQISRIAGELSSAAIWKSNRTRACNSLSNLQTLIYGLIETREEVKTNFNAITPDMLSKETLAYYAIAQKAAQEKKPIPQPSEKVAREIAHFSIFDSYLDTLRFMNARLSKADFACSLKDESRRKRTSPAELSKSFKEIKAASAQVDSIFKAFVELNIDDLVRAHFPDSVR